MSIAELHIFVRRQYVTCVVRTLQHLALPVMTAAHVSRKGLASGRATEALGHAAS